MSIRKWLLNNKNTKLPFTKPPLRTSGEAVREKLDEEVISFALFVIMIPFFIIIFTIYNAIFLTKLPFIPFIIVNSVVILPVFLVLFYFARKKLKIIRNYRIGCIGESVVGQELERSRKLGYSVFHDIQNYDKKFNVDHIAIGPAGIIVVETKAKSKPKSGVTEIHFNGDNLVFSDGAYTSDPLRQVKYNAEWIQEMAHRLIAEKKNPACPFNKKNPVPAVPIVVYPGWYINYEEAARKKATIKVTNDSLLVDNLIKKLDPSAKLNKEMITELQLLFGEHLREENKWRIE